MSIPNVSPTNDTVEIILQPVGGGNYTAILGGFGSTILASNVSGEAAALTAGAAALTSAGWPSSTMAIGRLISDCENRYPPRPLSVR